ncbi:hypothetical protein F4809DRAFT_585990 [Biscogniauxia mediterranea]|nr:hypothetical protein F4809DRAFT_585990 [Biscogniauxia mediterranea]
MMKTQIVLGVLSIPSAFDTLGIVPGVICLCAVALPALLVTTMLVVHVGAFSIKTGYPFLIITLAAREIYLTAI